MTFDGFPIPEALYIHVPFCVSRCTYCDFYSNVAARAGVGSMEGVIRRTLDRAEALAARFGADHFDTVYVGGGTPSCLPRPLLRRLLSGLGRIAGVPREWTVEANPESVDPCFLDILEESGVNRLSMGIQTLDPALARVLGRPGTPADSLAALRLATSRHLRVSADLIGGSSREGSLVAEAGLLVGEGIGHLSVYDLVLEEGTPLEALHRRGDFALMDEDEAADEREALNEGL
ncbi:MAG: radical SAM protein, partial [Rectinemataceae bacterium]